MTNNSTDKSPWNGDDKEALLDAEAERIRQQEELGESERIVREEAPELFEFIKAMLRPRKPSTPEERQAYLVSFLEGLVQEAKDGKLVGICGITQSENDDATEFKLGRLLTTPTIGALQVLTHKLVCHAEESAVRSI